MRKKRLKIYLPLALIVILVAGIFIWLSDYSRPTEEALAVFNSISNVEFSKDKFITFTPKDKKVTTGFIFYPGGKVAPEAYAPLCSKIASYGYKVVIVPMPFNLAVLNGDKAKEVEAQYPDIKNWVIGGHSLGGVMAANFAYKHPSDIKGLIMFAAYPMSSEDLSKNDLKVLSVWGTEDGCADISKVTGAKDVLPKDAEFRPIDGGNHAQFGNYGKQKGDNEAKIPTSQQQALAVEYAVSLLSEASK